MPNYAKAVDGIVTTVVVADDDFLPQLVDDSPGDWSAAPGHVAIGFKYDRASGVFTSGAPTPSQVALAEIRAIEAPWDDDFKKITRQFMLAQAIDKAKVINPTFNTQQAHDYCYALNKSYRIMYEMEQQIAPKRALL